MTVTECYRVISVGEIFSVERFKIQLSFFPTNSRSTPVTSLCEGVRQRGSCCNWSVVVRWITLIAFNVPLCLV